MRGLTLTEPWASLVAIGAKRIETRGFATAYKGPLAIHAAKKLRPESCDIFDHVGAYGALRDKGIYCGMPEWASANKLAPLPLGHIVAVATLVHVFPTRDPKRVVDALAAFGAKHEADFGNYTPGRYGWVLGGVCRLTTPIPFRGVLGLWHVPPDVERAITEQVTALLTP